MVLSILLLWQMKFFSALMTVKQIGWVSSGFCGCVIANGNFLNSGG
jgi:hypothetical protein